MALQNKTVRITEEAHKSLSEGFGQFSTACQLILEPFDKLRQVTISEIKGAFSKEQITALVDSQNGVMLTPDFIYNKSFLITQLEDFERLENGFSRHNADLNSFIDKLEKLSQTQVYYLLLDIHIFWNMNGSLNEYLDKFSN